jgi:hypothetical protein
LRAGTRGVFALLKRAARCFVALVERFFNLLTYATCNASWFIENSRLHTSGSLETRYSAHQNVEMRGMKSTCTRCRPRTCHCRVVGRAKKIRQSSINFHKNIQESQGIDLVQTAKSHFHSVRYTRKNSRNGPIHIYTTTRHHPQLLASGEQLMMFR